MKSFAPANAALGAPGRPSTHTNRTAGFAVRVTPRPDQNIPSDTSAQPNSADLKFQRRQALQAVLAGIAAVGAAAGPAYAAADLREGEVSHTDTEWKKLLNSDQYAVLRTAATERPFSSPLANEHRRGVFYCAGCASPLYESSAKYESGTGWPSFYAALPGAVDETSDNSIFFMPRTEVRCHKCKGHLGHVFPDGPEPTGLRYCMNGAAMTFKPTEA